MTDDSFNLLGISNEEWARTPTSVRLALLSVVEIVQSQSARLRALEQEVQELRAKLGQNSRTSSKPPSSDPPSTPPKPPRVPRGRKAGAQPGHLGHHRPQVPPERVDEFIDLVPEQCPQCQATFAANLPTVGPPQSTQVWELPPIQPHITEYRQHTRFCACCRRYVRAPLPPDAPPGAFGPRATALMALLRAEYGASLDATAAFFHSVLQLPVSPGCIVSSCERASTALAPVDAHIQQVVQQAAEVNSDETSWPMPRGGGWLWTAVAKVATCFRLHQSRGREGLKALLGEQYRGMLMSDRLVTYDILPPGQRQCCWAHLQRNLLGFEERYGADTGWARAMLGLADELFVAWKLYKGGWVDLFGLQQALIPVRTALRDCLVRGLSEPQAKIARFSRKLLGQWESLFAFSRVEGLEPTNNTAERALRHAVLWRKGSFGSRSEEGCRFVERMLSVRATCAQQGRELFGFLAEAIQAAWRGAPAPVLVYAPHIA